MSERHVVPPALLEAPRLFALPAPARIHHAIAVARALDLAPVRGSAAVVDTHGRQIADPLVTGLADAVLVLAAALDRLGGQADQLLAEGGSDVEHEVLVEDVAATARRLLGPSCVTAFNAA